MKKSKKGLKERDAIIAKCFKTAYVQNKLKAVCDNLGIDTSNVLKKDCGLYTEHGELIPEVSEIVNGYLMIDTVLANLKNLAPDTLYPMLKAYLVDIKAVDSIIEYITNISQGKTNDDNMFKDSCPEVAAIFIK
jgi:hypothetical protein